MASNMIEELRKQFQKIREYKSKTRRRLTADTLAKFQGFELIEPEQRQKIAEAINDYAKIVLMNLNYITTKRNETLSKSLSQIRIPRQSSQK